MEKEKIEAYKKGIHSANEHVGENARQGRSMPYKFYDCLMMAMLNCKKEDLEKLKKVNFLMGSTETLAQYCVDFDALTIDKILDAVFMEALCEVEYRINLQIRCIEWDEIAGIRDLMEDERKQVSILRKLDPFNDFTYRINENETVITIINNADIYEKYLDVTLDNIEHYTGFKLER